MRDKLPLSTTDKAVMAEFIGTQMCRGVQYRGLHRGLFDQREPMLRERVRAIYREHAPERIAEAETYDITRVIGKNQVIGASMGTEPSDDQRPGQHAVADGSLAEARSAKQRPAGDLLVRASSIFALGCK